MKRNKDELEEELSKIRKEVLILVLMSIEKCTILTKL